MRILNGDNMHDMYEHFNCEQCDVNSNRRIERVRKKFPEGVRDTGVEHSGALPVDNTSKTFRTLAPCMMVSMSSKKIK